MKTCYDIKYLGSNIIFEYDVDIILYHQILLDDNEILYSTNDELKINFTGYSNSNLEKYYFRKYIF